MICRNRMVGGRPSPFGGVALAYRSSLAEFREIDMPNQDNFEVLGTIGSLRGHSRRIVVVSCYVPPNYVTTRARDCLEYIVDLVVEIKRKYTPSPDQGWEDHRQCLHEL